VPLKAGKDLSWPRANNGDEQLARVILGPGRDSLYLETYVLKGLKCDRALGRWS
jgi:hypothetical protein